MNALIGRLDRTKELAKLEEDEDIAQNAARERGSRKHNREASGSWEERGRDAPTGEANLETRQRLRILQN